MSTVAPDQSLEHWLAQQQARIAAAVAQLKVNQGRFMEAAARAAANIAARAEQVEAKQAALELKPRPPVELDACLRKLAEQGPDALTPRERRAIVSHPDRVPVRSAERVLWHSPSLLRHLVRAVLSNWYQYRGQAWGAEYLDLLCAAKHSGVPLLDKTHGGARRVLSRSTPSGDVQLAAVVPEDSVVLAYQYLKVDLGLRDSWLYTGQVMASWLEEQLARGKLLNETVDAIRNHPRMRSLLLPHVGSAAAVAGVRPDTLTHARVVATLLRAGFDATARLAPPRLAEIVDDLMRSDFKDPRLPPLGQGWCLVRQLAEEPFQRLLASLSEQDLEVFFAHAMNDPDRRKFWTRYLPHIERTGCVLDASSQDSLRMKLQASPELRGAISRAYGFRHASPAHAFFLVFANIVVVEFSNTGHAAYVYERAYFEETLEKRVMTRRCDSAPDLKVKSARIHKFDHHRNWQEKAEEWLSQQGIHGRRARTR